MKSKILLFCVLVTLVGGTCELSGASSSWVACWANRFWGQDLKLSHSTSIAAHQLGRVLNGLDGDSDDYQGLITLCFTCSHWFLLRQPRPVPLQMGMFMSIDTQQ